MTTAQAKSLLTRCRLATARLEELLLARDCYRGPPGEDSADGYAVSLVLQALRRLAECAAEKEMPLAEKVRLGLAYCERANRRRGRRRRGEEELRAIVPGFPWVVLRKGMRTQDGAAAVAGFGSRTAFRAAVAVVNAGLAAKVDAGEKSLFEAAREARQRVRA